MSFDVSAPPHRSTYLAIGLCSVGILMQEILLTRIFSLTIWYHLAYLTISTALLGFGAAGSLLAARPRLLEAGVERLAAYSAAGAGLALLLAMAVLGPRPIDPDRLLSTPGPLFLGLLAYYVLVTVPFLLGGIAIAAPLSLYPRSANRLYAADLLGAGLGCACAVAALSWTDGPAAIALCAAVLLASGALYARGRGPGLAFAVLAVAAAAGAPLADRVLEFVPAETKALGKALRDPSTEVLFTRWSPVNRVDVYRGASPPGGWWGNKGIATGYRGPRPRTISIQYDGHNGSDVMQWTGPDSLRMLDRHILRTPYVVAERPQVLVIGVGGGIDVMNAVRQGAERVTGVDLQPITVELHRGALSHWTGGVFEGPGVELVAAEGRHFVRSTDAVFDLVQITAVDTFSAQTTGAYVLAESYLYTVEAFQDYLAHLSDGGLVSLVVGDFAYEDESLPPPLGTRLAMVGRTALERAGAEDPARHLMLVAKLDPIPFGSTAVAGVRGVYTENVLVKKTPFTPEEISRVRRFARANGFLVVVSPDAPGASPAARVVQAADAEQERVLQEQRFLLRPVTDEQPFFFHVLPWSSLATGQRILWMFPGSATGQIVLLMMLAQAVVLGSLLILLPLLRTGTGRMPVGTTLRFLLYFLGLGLGFLLIEISFVQKYVLVLGYPTYSLSVTIFSLLVFAALGAFLCRRGWGRPRRFLHVLLACTAALVVLEVALLPWIRHASLGWSLAARIAVTAGLQLPLGIVLGMYFPTGLELLRRREPHLIPWAWAVNGVASVAATVLAVILAMQIGFSGVALVAIGIYAVGTLALASVLRDEPAA